MDQMKTGRFIAQCRKEKGLTQFQLGELLGITDRAVSKWERGLSLPDASIMQDLCDILGITINELFTGERLEHMENYNKKAEENLLEMKKKAEEQSRQMLRMSNVIGAMSAALFLVGAISLVKEGRFDGSFIHHGTQPPTVEFVVACIGAFAGLLCAGEVERKAGYYKCKECGHEYVCNPGEYIRAPHFGRTRYMKCPECGKRSWQKKVLTKDDSNE